MLKNYFKLAYRNLFANKLVSGINIFGLSIAIGCCIVVFLFLKNYYTMDNFHVNADNIYIAEYVVENNGSEQIYGNSPMPLGPAMAENFPQIERSVRVEMESIKCYHGDKVFDEYFYFTDPGYFDMFSFPLAEGSTEVLNELNGIIISHELAERYFPNENAMEKTLMVGFGNTKKQAFIIKGIAAPFPENTGFKFDLLAGFNALNSLQLTDTENWATMTKGTFIQLKPEASIKELENNMAQYISLHNAANPDREIKSFLFENLKNPNPNADEVNRRPVETPHPMVSLMFGGIALLMLALSCFNYINIALGQAANRLKEIGIRKVVGGRKRQLIGQFMSENLLLCLIAVLFGLAFAQLVLVPYFNSVFTMKISLSLTDNYGIWIFLLGLLALTGVASGAYPAIYISSFQTVSIFRGKSSFSKKSKLAKTFLCLQFMLAFGTVIGGILFYSMSDAWKKQSWGYEPEGTLVIRLDDAKQFNLLKNKALQNPAINHIGGGFNHIGESKSLTKIYIEDKELQTAWYGVSAGYFEALGLQLTQGRFFDPLRKTEDENSVIVNHTFLKENNWDEFTDQQIRSNGKNYNIIGVVDDFKMIPTGANKAALFFLAKEDNLSYLSLRYEPGKGEEIEAYMQTAWNKLESGTPFSFFHQNLVFDSFFQEFNMISKLFGYISALALLIACMGLFGLASQNYVSRLKESGIRKVLGASSRHIIFQANRNFISLLLIASIFATAICFGIFQLASSQAADFIGNIQLGMKPYIFANALVFFMAAIAVAWQSYKLTVVMPAETLRTE